MRVDIINAEMNKSIDCIKKVIRDKECQIKELESLLTKEQWDALERKN